MTPLDHALKSVVTEAEFNRLTFLKAQHDQAIRASAKTGNMSVFMVTVSFVIALPVFAYALFAGHLISLRLALMAPMFGSACQIMNIWWVWRRNTRLLENARNGAHCYMDYWRLLVRKYHLGG